MLHERLLLHFNWQLLRCHLHSHEGTAQTRSVQAWLLLFAQRVVLEAHTQTFCMIGGVLIEVSWCPLPLVSSAVVSAFSQCIW